MGNFGLRERTGWGQQQIDAGQHLVQKSRVVLEGVLQGWGEVNGSIVPMQTVSRVQVVGDHRAQIAERVVMHPGAGDSHVVQRWSAEGEFVGGDAGFAETTVVQRRFFYLSRPTWGTARLWAIWSVNSGPLWHQLQPASP